MKNFFSLEYFNDVKPIFICESIILLISILMSYAPNNIVSFIVHNFNLFNLWAALISTGIWTICSFVDPKKYFNFFTLISTAPFVYGLFWCMLTFITI